jgi:hypothetical protein
MPGERAEKVRVSRTEVMFAIGPVGSTFFGTVESRGGYPDELVVV